MTDDIEALRRKLANAENNYAIERAHQIFKLERKLDLATVVIHPWGA